MGKNKNRQRNHQEPAPPPHATLPAAGLAGGDSGSAPAPEDLANQIRGLSNEADNLMTEEDLAHPFAPPTAPVESEINLRELWNKAHEAQELFKRAHERAEKVEKAAQENLDSLRNRDKALTISQRELEDQKLKLDRREREILASEKNLKEREIAAEAGFLEQSRGALVKLDQEAKALAQQISEHHQTYLGGIKSYETELRTIRERELSGLDQERQQLQLVKQEVAKAKREAEWANQDAEDLKTNWIERVQEKVRDEVLDRESRLQSALAKCEDLAKQISRYEESDRVAGGKTREQLLAELTASREQNAKLASALAQKPSDEQVAQLSGLQRERETLMSDMGRLRQENQSLTVQLGKLSVGVADLQNLRDQKTAWESRERALRTCVDDLSRELGALVDKSKAQCVFPSLIEMDTDATLQTPPGAIREKLSSLKDLAVEIRNRIGLQKFYYREKDVRAFLAGLATSRLHLLQGISGTGKTSLPREFAKAIGATSEIVEVQSSWRDRNDLQGYYNAFERRYYESPFLQALYRAQQPRNRDFPFFIILDEMNLSHPEHYFADFLSALEQGPDNQRVSLLTFRIDGAPKLLEDARWIRIPKNVWFIGTANHDETTKDFADKTYDRSHVMEFPRHPDSFSAQPLNSPLPITQAAIDTLFRRAAETHKEVTSRAKKFLGESLSPQLDKLGLGWGNRLESQMSRYVPVAIEAGGTLAEAMDHIVATKLLRKLRGRFDIGSKQLEELQKNILQAWNELDKSAQPEKCNELLEREIKRLSGSAT